MKLISPSFEHNQLIPKKFTCDGDDINPELEIQGTLAHPQAPIAISLNSMPWISNWKLKKA